MMESNQGKKDASDPEWVVGRSGYPLDARPRRSNHGHAPIAPQDWSFLASAGLHTRKPSVLFTLLLHVACCLLLVATIGTDIKRSVCRCCYSR